MSGLGDGMYRLRDEKQKLTVENAGRDELKNNIADMGAFPRAQPAAIAEYDESPQAEDRSVRRLIEKVTVYTASADARDKFTVEFKSGLTVDVYE